MSGRRGVGPPSPWPQKRPYGSAQGLCPAPSNDLAPSFLAGSSPHPPPRYGAIRLTDPLVWWSGEETGAQPLSRPSRSPYWRELLIPSHPILSWCHALSLPLPPDGPFPTLPQAPPGLLQQHSCLHGSNPTRYVHSQEHRAQSVEPLPGPFLSPLWPAW